MKQISFVDYHVAQTISPTDPVKLVFDAIDWKPIRNLLPEQKPKGKRGPNSYNRISMLKALLLIPLREAFGLRNRAKVLKEKPRLSYLCGFSFGQTPAHNTFSLFIENELIEDDKILRLFHILVAQIFALAKICESEIGIDGTHLLAQPNDPEAKVGFKTKTFYFFGYKVILLVSVKEPLFPIAVEVVPGNQSETPQFSKTIDQFRQFHSDMKVKKVFGDAAYDSNDNFKIVIDELKAKPFIALNQRGKKNPFLTREIYLNDEGKLYCLGGRELVYWGEEKKRRRVKYRCPIAVEDGNCLFASLCNRSAYGRSFYIGKGTEFRLQGIALTGKKRWKKEYSQKRSRLEAENGILKINRSMKNFSFRGRRKVKFYVVLCCLGELGKRLVEVRAKRVKHRRVA